MSEHDRTTDERTRYGAPEHDRRMDEADETPGGTALNDDGETTDRMPGSDEAGSSHGGVDDDLVGDDQSSPGQNSDRLPQ